MTQLQLTKARIQAGKWEGILTRADGQSDTPSIEVTHLSQPIEEVSISPLGDQAGSFAVHVTIPASVLCDGVQTFVISDKDSGDTLNSFSIVTGQPLDNDIRAEVDFLREELDMLKRAFRRHCTESS